MKSKILLLLFVAAGFCAGCFMWDSSSDTVTGKYSTLWIDLEENRALCEKLENEGSWSTLIEPYVFAVGHNDDFIIVKQHPAAHGMVNLAVTNYYIVNIRNPEAQVSGPHLEEAFEKLRRRVGASDIKFDQLYPERP